MSKFIYVFSESDRNKLLSLGYRLLKEKAGDYFIFDNDRSLTFPGELDIGTCFFSDTLTF